MDRSREEFILSSRDQRTWLAEKFYIFIYTVRLCRFPWTRVRVVEIIANAYYRKSISHTHRDSEWMAIIRDRKYQKRRTRGCRRDVNTRFFSVSDVNLHVAAPRWKSINIWTGLYRYSALMPNIHMEILAEEYYVSNNPWISYLHKWWHPLDFVRRLFPQPPRRKR